MLHRKSWQRKGSGGSKGSKQAQKQLPMYNHHILTGCSSSNFIEIILCNCGHLTALLSSQATQSRGIFWKKPSPNWNIHHLFQPWRHWRKWEENFSFLSVVSTLLILFLTRTKWENTSLHKNKLQLSIMQEAVYLLAGEDEVILQNFESEAYSSYKWSFITQKNPSVAPGKRVSMILMQLHCKRTKAFSCVSWTIPLGAITSLSYLIVQLQSHNSQTLKFPYLGLYCWLL